MTTLTIPRDRLAADLKPGDRIVAIDGRPAAHEVTEAARPSGGIPMRNQLVGDGTGSVWALYPDTQVERDVTIERAPEPRKAATAKPRRERRWTRYGLTLVTGRPRNPWETEDGAYSLSQGWAMTFCDGPHPMRWKDDDGITHTGYCHGDKEHPYVVGWVIDGPQIPGVRELAEPHETFDEAWAFLARVLGKDRP